MMKNVVYKVKDGKKKNFAVVKYENGKRVCIVEEYDCIFAAIAACVELLEVWK